MDEQAGMKSEDDSSLVASYRVKSRRQTISQKILNPSSYIHDSDPYSNLKIAIELIDKRDVWHFKQLLEESKRHNSDLLEKEAQGIGTVLMIATHKACLDYISSGDHSCPSPSDPFLPCWT